MRRRASDLVVVGGGPVGRRLPCMRWEVAYRLSCSSPDRARSTRRAVKVSCPAAYMPWPPLGSTPLAGI